MRVRLRHDRLARHLARSRRSQNAWAQRLHLSRGHLSDLVKGKHPYPSAQTRETLLNGLELSFEDLFEIEESPTPSKGARQPRPSPTPAAAATPPRQPDPWIVHLVLAILLVTVCSGAWRLWDQLFLTPLPYPEPDRLIVIRERVDDQVTVSPSWPNFNDLRERTRLLESVAAYIASGQIPVRHDTDSVALPGAIVTDDFFETLQVSPHLGTWPAGPPSVSSAVPVAISFDLWRERFESDPGVVGSPLRVLGAPATLVAVLPRGFSFPGRTQVWMPHAFVPHGEGGRRSHNLSQVIARLGSGVEWDDAALELDAIAQRLTAHYTLDPGFGFVPRPLQEFLHRRLASRVHLIVFVAALLWLLGLLAACARLGSTRGGRVAVAAGLIGWAGGAAVAETVFSTLEVSAAAGPALAGTWLPTLRLAALTLTVALSLGLVPAFYARRRLREDPADPGPSWRRLAPALGAGTAALVLLGPALSFAADWWQLERVDPGFDPAGLIEVRLNVPAAAADASPRREKVYALHREILREVGALDGVAAASLAFSPPLSDALKGNSAMRRVGPAEAPVIRDTDFRIVSSGYFETVGLRRISGRLFTPSDGLDAEPVAVVNQSFAAKVWGTAEPIGERMFVPGQAFHPWPGAHPLRIVGVVSDVRQRDLRIAPHPALYVTYTQHPVRAPYMRLLVRAAERPEVVAALVWQVIHEVDPEIPASQPRMLEELIDQRIHPVRFSAVVALLGAALALVLAGVVLGESLRGWRARRA